MTSKPSVTGGACIIASVCVGAGMLGLPSAGAGAWTSWSSLAIILTMIIMTVSGWMLLEAFKPYELTASFNSVTKDLLGHKIKCLQQSDCLFRRRHSAVRLYHLLGSDPERPARHQ